MLLIGRQKSSKPSPNQAYWQLVRTAALVISVQPGVGALERSAAKAIIAAPNPTIMMNAWAE